MRRMWPVAVVVLAFTALGLANVLRAPLGGSAAAKEAQTRLDQVPLTIGPWVGKITEVPEKQLRLARAQAHLSRSYSHNGTTMNVLILFGDPGQLGAHTPEVCYEGAGYRQASPITIRSVPNEPAEFWTAKFESGGYPPTSIQMNWGWGADGVWKVSDSPRLDFAGQALIYKLYFSRQIPPAPSTIEKDPTDEFLGPFLKELNAALTRPLTPPGATPPR